MQHGSANPWHEHPKSWHGNLLRRVDRAAISGQDHEVFRDVEEDRHRSPRIPGEAMRTPGIRIALLAPVFALIPLAVIAQPSQPGEAATAEGAGRPDLQPGGHAPWIMVIEGIDADGKLTVRDEQFVPIQETVTVEKPARETVEEDGQRKEVTRYLTEEQTRTRMVWRSVRHPYDLSEIRVYDRDGRAVTGEAEIRRWLGRPGMVLGTFAQFCPIDPAYLKLGRPGVPLVVLHPAELMPGPPPGLAPGLNMFLPQAAQNASDLDPAGNNQPSLGIVESVTDEGRLRFRYVVRPPVMKTMTRTVEVQKEVDGQPRTIREEVPVTVMVEGPPVAIRGDYPLDEVHVYDLDGQRITDEARLRRLFARPGLVLYSTQGRQIDPAYLKVAAEGVVYVALPMPEKASFTPDPRALGIAVGAVVSMPKAVPTAPRKPPTEAPQPAPGAAPAAPAEPVPPPAR
jgi:hypothetical protein